MTALIGLSRRPPATPSADWFEVRLGLNADFLDVLPGDSCLVSARSDQSLEARHQFLLKASTETMLIELDVAHDVTPELLAIVPPHRRVVACYDVTVASAAFESMQKIPARWYRIVGRRDDLSAAMDVLRLQKALNRNDVICYAEGWACSWTRLLAPYFGAPVIFGSDANEFIEPGAFPLHRLRNDYNFPAHQPLKAVAGIVGGGVHASRSPLIHNQRYREQNLPFLFLPFQPASFGSFTEHILGARGLACLGLETPGFVVTAPFKQAMQEWADTRDDIVRKSGGGNVLLNRSGRWHATTTDHEGIRGPLANDGIDVRGRRAAVVGVGGTGKAAAAMLREAGAIVTLINRRMSHGQAAADSLGVNFLPLEEFQAHEFSVIVHATPVGKGDEAPLFSLSGTNPGSIFFEYLYRYSGRSSTLVEEANQLGLMTISGEDILEIQVDRQFTMIRDCASTALSHHAKSDKVKPMTSVQEPGLAVLSANALGKNSNP